MFNGNSLIRCLQHLREYYLREISLLDKNMSSRNAGISLFHETQGLVKWLNLFCTPISHLSHGNKTAVLRYFSSMWCTQDSSKTKVLILIFQTNNDRLVRSKHLGKSEVVRQSQMFYKREPGECMGKLLFEKHKIPRQLHKSPGSRIRA